MKRYCFLKNIILLFTMVSVISCPLGNDGDNPPGPGDPLYVGITAHVIDLSVHLSWPVVDNLASFSVFRKIGPGDYEQIDTVNESTMSYMDNTCPYNETLVYYILFTLNDNPTFESSESNSVMVMYNPPAVTNLNASELEYDNMIGLYWDADPVAESYIIYRYTEKSEFGLDHIFDSNGISNTFNDGEAQDMDWYKYTGTETLMDIVVTLPSGTPFDSELTLEIDNNGNKIILEQGTNTLGYAGGDDLYIKIYFTSVDPDPDVLGAYTIKLIFY